MKVKEGVITWDNGADIDPDVLYYGLEASLDGRASSCRACTRLIAVAAQPGSDRSISGDMKHLLVIG